MSGVEEVVLRGVAGTVKTTVKTDWTVHHISLNICYSDIYTLLVGIRSILINSSANPTHELNVCWLGEQYFTVYKHVNPSCVFCVSGLEHFDRLLPLRFSRHGFSPTSPNQFIMIMFAATSLCPFS